MTNAEHRQLLNRLMIAYAVDQNHPEKPIRMKYDDLMDLPLSCPGEKEGMYKIIIAAAVAHFRKDWRN